MNGYFDELAVLLRERGVPAERVASTIEELSAFAEEGSGDPEEEFGPVAAFAEQLGAGKAEAAPDEGVWRWTADIFADQMRLNEFGAQGWEVETVDAHGMFISRRDPERPQRWEYRREVVSPPRRQAAADRLAPDGWEPCGTWFQYAYFKRPGAASVGPAAELHAPPPAPERRTFFSRRFYLLVAAVVALCVLAVVLIGISLVKGGVDGTGFVIGAAVGAAGVLVAFWLTVRRQTR